jgi:hypothetical protein
VIAAWLLVSLGLSSFVGHVSGSSELRRYARSTMASPLPLAFSDCGSLRNFSDRFGFDVVTSDGGRMRAEADAAIYAALPGPYERRVMYGAALSLAPVVPSPLFRGILHHGFCDRGPIATALGFAQPLREATISTPGRPDLRSRPVTVSCDP